jgi:autotransporter family porin
MTIKKPSRDTKHRLLVSTAMLGALCAGYGRRAYAACTGAAGNYNCSGALTTTQNLSFSSLGVTTEPPFSIITTSGDAFTLTATSGSLTFSDNNSGSPSTITAQAGNAISATIQGGSLALVIDTNGTITSNGTGLGASNGIKSSNNGTGVTTIASYGNVTATGSNGHGIEAFVNFGGGALSITTTGIVSATGSGGIGIYVQSHTAAATKITTGQVSGGPSGIGIETSVPTIGPLTITTNGTVSGGSTGNSTGIEALSYSAITINANKDVTGTLTGISGSSSAGQGQNGGLVSITATGTVTGSNGDGIVAHRRRRRLRQRK